MDTLQKKTILMLCLFGMSFGLFAQSQANAKTALNNSPNVYSSSVKKETKQYQSKATSSYRYHKKLPATFTGFVIELEASNYPLERGYPLFKQFGNVYYDKLEQGGYSYVIKTNFSKSEAIEKFLADVIIHKAPEARVLEYKLGKRKTI